MIKQFMAPGHSKKVTWGVLIKALQHVVGNVQPGQIGHGIHEEEHVTNGQVTSSVIITDLKYMTVFRLYNDKGKEIVSEQDQAHYLFFINVISKGKTANATGAAARLTSLLKQLVRVLP